MLCPTYYLELLAEKLGLDCGKLLCSSLVGSQGISYRF